MAIFNILGFNQEKIIAVQQEKQINLNGNDLIVLRNIVDIIDSNRLENKEIGNKKYTWIKYSLLVKNLMFVSDKEDTFKKIITKLIKCVITNTKSNFDLFITLRESGYSLKHIYENKLLELSYGTLKNYNSKYNKL